jgi:hypothetical protein
MKRHLAVLLVACVGFVGTARAEDKPNPTGTWKWTVTNNDQKRDVTLRLKLDGDKLIGALMGRNNQETKIDDATFKDGAVTFSVTRERNGQKMTTKYNGKITGDTLKGKIEFERDGKPESRDWEATRAKD